MSNIGISRVALYVVAAGAIGILVNFVVELQRSSQEQHAADIRAEATIFIRAVEANAARLIEQAQSIGSLFESSNMITEQEFKRFVGRSRYLDGPRWARWYAVMPALDVSELADFQTSLDARAKSRSDFGYAPFKMLPVDGRTVYAPVVYADNNQSIGNMVGRDLAASPRRMEAARAALLTSFPHLTPPVKDEWVTGSEGPTVMVISAVRLGNIGLRDYLGPEHSRDLFIVIGYSPADAISDMFENLPVARRFWLRVADVTGEPEGVIFASDEARTTPRLTAPRMAVLGNRVWSFEFGPRPSAMDHAPKNLINVLAVAIGLLILALTYLLDRVVRDRGKLEQAVKTQTEQLRTANKALAAAAQRANAENDAKSEFLARMSHDLRTPLNAVIGYAQMMTSEVYGTLGAPQYREYAKTIEKAGRIQLDLVSDILTLSALMGSEQSFKYEPLDLDTLAKQCRDIVYLSACDRGVSVEIENLLDDREIFGDIQSLQQIMLNLLSNALKFTDAGGSVLIVLETAGETGYAINVVDTGVGIAEDDIEKALQPFSKLDQNPYIVNAGVGLGLTIVKNLAEGNGGTLKISSEPGVGTKVTVCFEAAGRQEELPLGGDNN